MIFIICIVLASLYTTIKNKEYENKNNQMKEKTEYIGIIISNPIPKEYYTQYTLKIKKTNIKVYLQITGKQNLEYGDKISIKGEYIEPDTARNDKGFNYKNYLKSNRNSRNTKMRKSKTIKQK